MSHDLYFTARGGQKLDRKAFLAHFKPRRHYQLGKGQALYQNEDTGVYFIFDEPEDGVVAFALNYFRPHTFALEAAIELEAFARAMDLAVADPQGDATEEEETFDGPTFIKRWNAGNRFAVGAMIEEQGPVHTWPAKRMREVWEWNYNRPREDDPIARELFVPAIFAIELGEDCGTVCIWPPRCSILLPQVDAVLVPLAQEGKQSESTALVPWGEAAPAVKALQEKAPGLPRYRVDFEEAWPAGIEAFLSAKRKAAGKLSGVGLDEILDRELVEAAQRSPPKG